MFTELKVNDFRALKNQTFKLGKYATMLSGGNATGKSTVLALLANSTELKPKDGKTYNGGLFRSEFCEILKGSQNHDKTAQNRLEIIWTDGISEIKKTFRTAWQDEDTRFRVIPREKLPNGKFNEAKFELPVIYLGLSRLYPLGEAEDDALKDKEQPFITNEDREWFKDNHCEILSTWDSVTGIQNIDLKGTKKNTSAINAKNYDWKSNSSGQDNLSQILLAVLSFKKLKRDPEFKYKGGLLLIDEIESSLHPIAQEKLVDFLVKEARSTNFQVIFTTHSLTIIENISKKNMLRKWRPYPLLFPKSKSEISYRERQTF